ncbi:hypothetical protein P279_23755 [Rhodobacteraceae bacterium PD-2]|nr:hypothetical protein P279_23755 [Rhodobacteraceae bacterium PD-2]
MLWSCFVGIGFSANAAFKVFGRPAHCEERPSGAGAAPCVDVLAAAASQPAIRWALPGDAAWENIPERMEPGDEAIAVFVAGR